MSVPHIASQASLDNVSATGAKYFPQTEVLAPLSLNSPRQHMRHRRYSEHTGRDYDQENERRWKLLFPSKGGINEVKSGQHALRGIPELRSGHHVLAEIPPRESGREGESK